MLERRPGIRFDLSPKMEEIRQRVEDLSSKTTVREWLSRGLLPGGFPPDEPSVVSTQLAIIERYHTLYRHADSEPGAKAPPFARQGFAVGDGWMGIIERLSAKLAADPNLIVGQVKEKYGRLTIYFESSKLSPLEEELDLAVDEAVKESMTTCEQCGQPGVLTARANHYVSVLCKECEI